uniref:Uncharacterized protein n=1 Tax=Bactrocera dorsalis TaxID=27457 RepID=A0A034VB05_BACDO
MKITPSSSNSKSTELHKYRLIKMYDQNGKAVRPPVQFYIGGGDNDDKDDAPTATAHTHAHKHRHWARAELCGTTTTNTALANGHTKYFFFSPTISAKLHARLTHIQ